MNHKYLSSLFGMSAAMVMAACSSDSPEPTPQPVENPAPEEEVINYQPLDLPAEAASACDANNSFAFNLYEAAVADDNIRDNACLSPFSLYEVLSMAANGDDGATRDEILRVITGGNTVTIEQLNAFNKAMSEGLHKIDKHATIKVANALWADKSVTVASTFTDLLAKYYNAESTSLDLNTESAMNSINAWCSDKTQGIINPFLTQRLQNEQIFLMNAIYFKAAWLTKFNAEENTRTEFTNLDGTTSIVDMMHMPVGVPYAEKNGVQMMKLYFGAYSFEIELILPSENTNFKTFATNLGQTVSTLENSMAHTLVTLSIPKFKASFAGDVNSLLRSLGIHSAFDYGLNAITTDGTPRPVQSVIQKVNFEIDEDGAEAAAASAIRIDGACPPTELSKATMTLNRPFIYILREAKTGAVLFIGQVTKF